MSSVTITVESTDEMLANYLATYLSECLTGYPTFTDDSVRLLTKNDRDFQRIKMEHVECIAFAVRKVPRHTITLKEGSDVSPE